MFNATSETVTPLFFQFLDENPRYKEAFKLYDQVLAQENDYKMQELTKAIIAMDVNYVVQNGELLNQWNTTSEVNGTTYTSMFKEYSLEINGTTLTVVKVTIMSSDGTVIVDPYLYVHKVNLFYLQFVIISWIPYWGIYVPCYYGWDIYSYVRFSNDTSVVGVSEAAAFLGSAVSELDGLTTTLEVYAAFCFVTGLVLLATPAAPAGAALGIMSGILTLAGVVASVAGTIILNEYLYSAAYNYARDPTFGICTMDRHHLIYTTNPVELWSWSTFHVVYCDGGVKQISPFPVGVYYYTEWWQALTIVNFFTWISSNFGFEHWVWMGPYVPPGIFG
ncbi:MAG: hypothetical protein ACUVXA_06460 [Candidatus Jordarchaeum sp.]|uniref:hypothetical protein n=1 Tax=Candidatus Jordarchaeum sp. TaxID=2823881 RepID=UPI00404B4EB3